MEHAVYSCLRGKRVVITGGGTGIGAAFVEAFARQGARVIFLDIADDESRELERKLSEFAPAPKFIRCDLRDVAAIHATFDRIHAEFGPVEVLVNNAANDDRHAVDKVTTEYWDERIATNLRHVFFCTQAVAPAMKTAGKGIILNLGSVSWHLALADLTVYQTAKAGIEGLTRALARDLGGSGIRVACIVPGGVRTPRQMRLWHNPEEEARILEQQCLKTRVEPEDVAAMALFLASDGARMCTGHEYFVDAGWR
jgi:NAD(P)-dependent dehydrogenase (short-subunit alcohol dehydrogenase family)